MKVAVGSDHAGFALKERVKQYLAEAGIEFEDLGTTGTEMVDYPDYAEKVAHAVRNGSADRGILMCGTGVGMCIAANKVEGIRAAAVWDPEIARLSRSHNDANVLCLPGRYMDPAFALGLAKIWMNTPFEGGRHRTRVEKVTAIESATLHSHSGEGAL
jgi:ribose 5-phosphate isomerase B